MKSTATRALVLLVSSLLVLLLACNKANVVRASVADELWNKYRVNIISLLQGRYAHYAPGLNHFGSNTNVDQTVLHIVTDPVEATWNTKISDLGDFTGYVPKWQTAWDVSFSASNSVAEKYKALLFSMADKSLASQKFAQFSSAPKTFEESPHHERLQAFAQRMSGKTTHDIHFVVQEGAGSTTIHSPWGVKTSSFSRMSSIVRELVQTGNNRAMMVDFNSMAQQDEDVQSQLNEFIDKYIDDEINGDEEEEEEKEEADEQDMEEDEEDAEEEEEVEDISILSESSFLFRRRRRRRNAPIIIQHPIIIKSKKFHMDFRAVGLIGIPVRAPFVDRHFIRQNRAKFQGNWFGAGGQFNLLPSIVWVAMKPQCTLRLSESEFKIMQQHWVSGKAMGMAVGGVFFRNNHFRQMAMSDIGNDVLGDVFSHSALEYMRDSGDLEDEATFEVKSLDAEGNEIADDATFTVKSDLEGEEDDESDFAMLAAQDQIESDSSFLFRRRRRRRRAPPPPPPPPPRIIEKVYEASFKSNSNVPQVLAITSDIL